MKNNTSSSGIGFTGLLLILFIALKLTGQIDWSWIWVLSPFWIPLALVVLVFAAFAIATAVTAGVHAIRGWYR